MSSILTWVSHLIASSTERQTRGADPVHGTGSEAVQNNSRTTTSRMPAESGCLPHRLGLCLGTVI